eukprot:7457697-Lingulodinium_polyedra.AAC.1
MDAAGFTAPLLPRSWAEVVHERVGSHVTVLGCGARLPLGFVLTCAQTSGGPTRTWALIHHWLGRLLLLPC